MELKKLIKDLPGSKRLTLLEVTNMFNFMLCRLVDLPLEDTLDVGDWIVSKVDKTTIYLSQKYTAVEMSRMMHDEFNKSGLIKKVSRL